jgi:hypothetical protein
VPQLGLGSSLRKPGGVGRTYVKDGLKLYMPYRGSDASEVDFVGTGSTSFDGSNDYVAISSTGLSLDDWTISCWVKVGSSNSGDYPGIFSTRSGSDNDYATGVTIQIYDDSTGYYFDIEGDAITNGHIGKVSANTPAEGMWYHLAYTVDRDGGSGGVKQYVDGVLANTLAAVDNATSMDNIQMGARYYSSSIREYFKGNIKNAAIWNRALTATEVQNVMYKSYAEVSGRLASGLVSWWNMDDADIALVGDPDSTLSNAYQDITSEFTELGTGTYKYKIYGDMQTAVTIGIVSGTAGATDSGYTDYIPITYYSSLPVTSDSFSYTSGATIFLQLVTTTTGDYAFFNKIEILDSNNDVLKYFYPSGVWTSQFQNHYWRFADSHGSNHGTSGDGSTDNTFPTPVSKIYGQSTPVIPRGIDNAPTVQADAIGAGSASFDGADDYIAIADSSDIQIAGDMSVALWMKRTDSAATDGLVVKRDGGGTNYQFDAAGDDKIRMYAGGDTVASATSVVLGEWTHVACTVDSGATDGCKLYINGVQDANTGDVTITANDAPLLFGHNDQDVSNFYNGNICQVGIWDAVLTQAQIQSVMEKTFEEFTASEKTNLVSYWALDEDVLSDTVVVDKVNPSYSLGSELLTNGDMELDDSSWTSVVSPVTNERSTEQVHGGTYSRKLVGDSSYDGMYQAITAVAGKKYLLTGWVYGDGTNKLYARFYDDGGGGIENFWIATSNDGVIVPAEWTYYSKAIVAVGTTLTVQFYQGDTSAGGVTFYADDISVKEIISDGNVGVLY